MTTATKTRITANATRAAMLAEALIDMQARWRYHGFERRPEIRTIINESYLAYSETRGQARIAEIAKAFKQFERGKAILETHKVVRGPNRDKTIFDGLDHAADLPNAIPSSVLVITGGWVGTSEQAQFVGLAPRD